MPDSQQIHGGDKAGGIFFGGFALVIIGMGLFLLAGVLHGAGWFPDVIPHMVHTPRQTLMAMIGGQAAIGMGIWFLREVIRHW